MQQGKLKIARIAYLANMLLGAASAGFIAYLAVSFPNGKWPESDDAISIFSIIFITITLLWAIFSYGAYKGLTSNNIALKIIFWVHTIWNLVTFPIGTAIAAICIYIWSDLKSTKN